MALSSSILPIILCSPRENSAIDDIADQGNLVKARGEDVLIGIQLRQLKLGALSDRVSLPSTAPSSASEPPRTLYEVYETLYHRLGRWVGPYASKLAKEAVLSLWVKSGEDGASWLVRRVAEEQNLDALEGASAAIIRMGRAAIGHIIAALNDSVADGDNERTAKFLGILEWFSPTAFTPYAAMLRAILQEIVVGNFNNETREAAYRCFPLLTYSSEIRDWALARETDPELQTVLKEQT